MVFKLVTGETPAPWFPPAGPAILALSYSFVFLRSWLVDYHLLHALSSVLCNNMKYLVDIYYIVGVIRLYMANIQSICDFPLE